MVARHHFRNQDNSTLSFKEVNGFYPITINENKVISPIHMGRHFGIFALKSRFIQNYYTFGWGFAQTTLVDLASA